MSTSELRHIEHRQLVVAAALMFILVPAVQVVGQGVGDLLTGAAAALTVIPIVTQMESLGRLAAAVTAFVGLYVLGAAFAPGGVGQAHAIRGVITIWGAASALMLFATFGRELLGNKAFRQHAVFFATIGIVAINFAGLPKNITGGSIVYLAAFIVVVGIYRWPRHASRFVLVFFLLSITIGYFRDFRGMVVYGLVLLLIYFASKVLTRKALWITGLALSVGVVGGVTWYYLHVYTSNLAFDISQKISEFSGRTAVSGRQILWPAIVEYVGDNKWFGAGVGTLPRDFLDTDLSAHSYYMQTYLQVGLVGVVLLVILLLATWGRMCAVARRNASGGFGAALLIMFVVHNGTEVIMFQNGLVAGVPAWCAIGLSYSLARSGVEDERKVSDSHASASRYRIR